MLSIKFTSTALTVGLLFSAVGQAGTVFSTGSGSAVSTVDRQATFDSIVVNGINLSNYTEGQLSITTAGISYVGFSPFNGGTQTAFFYANGGSDGFVDIKGTDHANMAGLEFELGDGFGFSTTNLLWESLRNGSVESSGFISGILKGTVVGFRDSAGFDELRVAASPNFSAASQFGSLQAIALDNVKVQLESAAVPEPATLVMWSLIAGVFGVGRLRNRRRALGGPAVPQGGWVAQRQEWTSFAWNVK